MTVTMSEDKKGSDDAPTFVIATPQMSAEPKKSRLTRKHILIAVVSLVITGLVVTGVLVGIRIYTDSNLETMKLQYSMTMKDKNNNDVKQNVSIDANVVQYDVEKDGVKATILQDFDKGMEVSKVLSDSGVVCYLTALNKTSAQDPSKIPTAAPNPDDKTPSQQLVYKVSETPVKDISFLGPRINKLCSNIPTYWMVPSCDNGDENMALNNTSPDTRTKRATVCGTCGGYSCVCGCCWAICGRFSTSTYTWSYNAATRVYTCTYYMYSTSCAVNLAPSNCYLNGRRYYYPWA